MMGAIKTSFKRRGLSTVEILIEPFNKIDSIYLIKVMVNIIEISRKFGGILISEEPQFKGKTPIFANTTIMFRTENDMNNFIEDMTRNPYRMM